MISSAKLDSFILQNANRLPVFFLINGLAFPFVLSVLQVRFFLLQCLEYLLRLPFRKLARSRLRALLFLGIAFVLRLISPILFILSLLMGILILFVPFLRFIRILISLGLWVILISLLLFILLILLLIFLLLIFFLLILLTLFALQHL